MNEPNDALTLLFDLIKEKKNIYFSRLQWDILSDTSRQSTPQVYLYTYLYLYLPRYRMGGWVLGRFMKKCTLYEGMMGLSRSICPPDSLPAHYYCCFIVIYKLLNK